MGSIRKIKEELNRLNILQDSYDYYEQNISIDEQKKGLCTVNDYLVQIWCSVKQELGTPTIEILKGIPKEQNWYKRIVIKGLVGRKAVNWYPLRHALSIVEDEPVEPYRKYQHLYYPIGERIVALRRLNAQLLS